MSFWVLVAVAAMIPLIVVGVLRTPRSPGRVSLIIAVLCGLWWTCCVIARNGSDDVEFNNFMVKLAWFGIVGVPLFWSLSFVTYARGEDCEKNWQIGALLAFTSAVGLAALTNDWHHGVYAPAYDLASGRNAHGLIYDLAMYIAYATMGAAFIYGLVRLRTAQGIHRWQLVALLMGALLPWASNIGFNFFSFRVFNDDPTPFVFAMTGAVLLSAQYFSSLFVVPPVGRDAIFAILPNPVVIVDGEGRILEINPAGAALPGIPKAPIGAILSEPPELASLIHDVSFTDDARGEVTIAASGKTYEIGCHALSAWGRAGGRMFLMHDITERKAGEATLNTLSRDLQSQLHDNLTLQRKLKEEASRDHLTGLFNRRHAYRVLPRLLSEAGRHQTRAMVVIDIDHFKSFNDRYGHDLGDKVIKRFGQILQSDPAMRDFAFRWGGEEFLVFLPDTDRNDAMAHCAHWRRMFAESDIGTVVELPLTFSAGIRLIEAGVEATLDDAVKAADDLLYDAKRAGRDVAFISEEAAPLKHTDAA